jgi:hypothetical protein
MSEALTVVNNPQDALVRVERQKNALSRLFQLKPSTLELVSKSTQQEGAKPGQFRDTATNEHFETMRAVILFEPVEQRELYRKGEYSRDAKLCFSLDNYQPHQAARDPKAMYCEVCPFGDVNWKKYREAKKQGVKGEDLSKLTPPCRKYWHLFIANRATKMPYYFNVKGTSVTPFEGSMQNIARLMHGMVQNINLQNRQIVEANKTLAQDQQQSLLLVPQSVADVIWQISFTMFVQQLEKGGQYTLGMKDFAVMKPEDYKDFGTILDNIKAAREARQLQSQLEAEAEAESTATANVESSAVETPANSSIAEKNRNIAI